MVVCFRRPTLELPERPEDVRPFFQHLIDRIQVLSLKDRKAARLALMWLVWFLDQNGV